MAVPHNTVSGMDAPSLGIFRSNAFSACLLTPFQAASLAGVEVELPEGAPATWRELKLRHSFIDQLTGGGGNTQGTNMVC